jgi:hypothetical protein
MGSIMRRHFNDPWGFYFIYYFYFCSGFSVVTSATLLHHLSGMVDTTSWSDCSFDFMMNQKQCRKSDISSSSAAGS